MGQTIPPKPNPSVVHDVHVDIHKIYPKFDRSCACAFLYSTQTLNKFGHGTHVTSCPTSIVVFFTEKTVENA
jgi:hypothetical protein